MKTAICWSDEIPFTTEAIKRIVPERPGVYQILQSQEYPRYKGKTRIVKIGESSENLKAEVLNHQARHTNANRLARVSLQPGIRISVICALVQEADAKRVQNELLCEFEDEHWDLPLLNSTRGYGRGEDRHYRGPTCADEGGGRQDQS